jgi:hypothetical protein
MYIVSPAEKKKIEEKVFFSHEDGRKITLVIGWRTGKVWCDDEPDLSEYDEDEGADMSFLVEYSDEEQIDGWFFEVVVEDGGEVSEEEKEKIEEAWNNNLEDGMRDIGWEWSDRELWFYGPLDVEEE